MKHTIFLFFLFNLAYSQNKSELIDCIRYIAINDSLVEYAAEGLTFDKYIISKNENYLTRKQWFDNRVNKKKYIIKEDFKLNASPKDSLINNSVSKYIYENSKKQNLAIYEYADLKNSRYRILVHNYNHYYYPKYDSIVSYILSKKVSDKSKIIVHKGVLNYDGLRLKVDSTNSKSHHCFHNIKLLDGYNYSLYYFKSKSEVEKHIRSEVKFLTARLPGFERNVSNITVNEKVYNIKQIFGNHLYGNKKEGYRTIYDNIIITWGKMGGQYIFIKAKKDFIYDKNDLIITDEYMDVLEQVASF